MTPTHPKTQEGKERKELELKVKEACGDWETVHCIYDGAIQTRLNRLDPKFMEWLDKLFEDATFWYA
jgi:hypothetical protein